MQIVIYQSTPHYFFGPLEFKKEVLAEREEEIAGYLLEGFSIAEIAIKTGLGKKILRAYLRNMMQKLKANDVDELVILMKFKQQNGHGTNSHLINHILKNNLVKKDKRFLQVMSLTVVVIIIVSFLFSAKYFTKFYEHIDQFEYVTSSQVH